VVVCLAGAGLIANTLLKRERVSPPRAHARRELGASLARLHARFRPHWGDKQLQPAPRADDLTIARRLSLALTGTVPSLEEIRALEAVPANDRIAWWTSHLLED